jgi:hypothetical protein
MNDHVAINMAAVANMSIRSKRERERERERENQYTVTSGSCLCQESHVTSRLTLEPGRVQVAGMLIHITPGSSLVGCSLFCLVLL